MPTWRTAAGVYTIVTRTGETTQARANTNHMGGVLAPPVDWPFPTEPSPSKLIIPEEIAAGAVDLDGVGSAAADLDGTLSIAQALDGKASAASDLDGTLSLALPLAGNANAASDLDGTLGVNRGIDGKTSAAADLDGELTITAGQIALDGKGVAAADLDGSLVLALALDGKASAASDLDGTLTVTGAAPPAADPMWMILVSTEGAILPRDMRGPGIGEPQRRGQARRRGSGRISP